MKTWVAKINRDFFWALIVPLNLGHEACSLCHYYTAAQPASAADGERGFKWKDSPCGGADFLWCQLRIFLWIPTVLKGPSRLLPVEERREQKSPRREGCFLFIRGQELWISSTHIFMPKGWGTPPPPPRHPALLLNMAFRSMLCLSGATEPRVSQAPSRTTLKCYLLNILHVNMLKGEEETIHRGTNASFILGKPMLFFWIFFYI